jgi:putative ABC transport system permease protein
VRVADIVGLALSSLWQQKVRTLLTMLGVVFGSFVLAASLSINQGVQETINREAHRSDFLRRIDVRPQWHSVGAELPEEDVPVQGAMSEAKRQRLRKAIHEHQTRFGASQAWVPITQEKLRALAALPHVESVVPVVYLHGFALLDRQAEGADVASVQADAPHFRQRIVAGRFFEHNNERAVVVSEFLLYRLGLLDDASMPTVLGKKLRLEFRSGLREAGFNVHLLKPKGEVSREEAAALDKLSKQLPAVLDKLDLLTEVEIALLRRAARERRPSGGELYAEEFTIVGVLRLTTEEEEKGPWHPLRGAADVNLPVGTATELFFRLPGGEQQGVDQAVVLVDREENVKEVALQVKALGLNGFSAVEFVERERLMYLLIFGGMTCVAAVALLVAALGIANTMLMSVLERTREIGIMKAVGAGNGQLQLIFLLEGALLGLVGGGLGLLLGWAASFPADAWLRSMVLRDLKIELKEAIFVFPPGLNAAVLLFAVLVTTLAAVYPARRAARVDPVAALRHE